MPETVRKTPALLTEVLRRFWWPVFAEVRRRGCGEAEARHLTAVILGRAADGHSFFRTDDFGGRLRQVVRNELAEVLNNPNRNLLQAPSLQLTPHETQLREGYDPGLSNDSFNCCWAIAILEQALENLRAEYQRQGKSAELQRLEPFLSRRVPDWHEVDIREAVGAAEVSNMRDRFQELVRTQVAETVTTPLVLEAELAELFKTP